MTGGFKLLRSHLFESICFVWVFDLVFGELLCFRVSPTKLFSLGAFVDYSPRSLWMAFRGVCDTAL